MNTRVFVTGMGLVGPCGNNVETFWKSLLSGKSAIKELKDGFFWGGQVQGLAPEQFIPKRILHKCARFSILSLLATHEAVHDAQLEFSEIDPFRIGIFVGNNSGGWESAKNGLYTLYRCGGPYVSPFMASNWFPAAVQGHISITYGIKGFSKTITADRMSSLLAIANAAQAIRMDKLEIAIVGGVETPLDPWALAFYRSCKILNEDIACIETAYQPFDNNRKGMVLGEGAAFFVLESEQSVKKRKKEHKIQANILASSVSSCGKYLPTTEESIDQLARVLTQTINDSDLHSGIDYISLDGAATIEDDYIEYTALKKVFGNKTRSIYAGCPKSFFGNTIGASGAFDLAMAILSMNHSLIPHISNLSKPDRSCTLNLIQSKPVSCAVHSALIISRDLFGSSSAMAITHNAFCL